MKVAVFSPFQMNKPSPHTTSIASVSASSASPASPNTPTATLTPTASSSPSSSSSSSSSLPSSSSPSSSTYNPTITTSAATTSPTSSTTSASTMATTTTTTTTTLGKVRPSHSPRVSPYPAPAASVPLGLGGFDLPVALNSSSASSGGQTIATLDAGSLSPPVVPQKALSLTADASEESEIARVTPTNPFSSSELAETERTGSQSPKSSRSSSPALLMEEAKQKIIMGAAASAGGQKELLAGERTPWCLIVDDNDVNLEVLRHNLNKYGIPFNVAKNGEVALEYACKHTYKFIIMDICMPGMDGFQSTIKIRNEERSLNKDTSIIAHTTLQNPLAYFRDRGLNDLLTKPFNKEDLLRILRTYAFAE